MSRSKEIRVVKREEEEDSYGKRNWRVGGQPEEGGWRDMHDRERESREMEWRGELDTAIPWSLRLV